MCALVGCNLKNDFPENVCFVYWPRVDLFPSNTATYMLTHEKYVPYMIYMCGFEVHPNQICISGIFYQELYGPFPYPCKGSWKELATRPAPNHATSSGKRPELQIIMKVNLEFVDSTCTIVLPCIVKLETHGPMQHSNTSYIWLSVALIRLDPTPI